MFDKKMADYFDTVYEVLHLIGYYNGVRNVKIIQTGFEVAYKVIDKIKPENLIEVKESRSGSLKRAFNTALISLAVTFR